MTVFIYRKVWLIFI